MSTLRIMMVAAMTENRVIGRGGVMPWRLPADLTRFRTLTMDKPIIMGRLTHESLGRVLDGRLNIVLSRQRGFQAEGFQAPQCIVAHSLDEAFDRACEAASSSVKEIAVIGGASVYEQALPRASHLYLTQIHTTIDGDARFPEIEAEEWQEVAREKRSADTRNDYDMSFLELVRRPTDRLGCSPPKLNHHRPDCSGTTEFESRTLVRGKL